MNLPIPPLLSLVLLLTLPIHPAHAEGVKSFRYRTQFQTWFPQFGPTFSHIMTHNCSVPYAHYLRDTPQNATIDRLHGGDESNTLTQPVVSCLLEHTPQFIMSSIQSAQVLLGLTPTILALLGASTEESATLAVVGQRPVLSLLLACGSPSVYLNRAFQFKDPAKILSKERVGRYRQRRAGGLLQSLNGRGIGMVVVQYVVALAAVTNVAAVNYEMAVRAVCGFATEWILMPLFWSTTVVLIYLVGVGWHRMRVKREWAGRGRTPLVRYLVGRLRREFCLSLYNGPVKIEIVDETLGYVVCGWILSVFSVLHIIFGTLTLSSMLFIGPRDALKVISRFLASGLSCRIIIMFELAGLRENYVPARSETDDGGVNEAEERACSETKTTNTAVVSRRLPDDEGERISPATRSALQAHGQ